MGIVHAAGIGRIRVRDDGRWVVNLSFNKGIEKLTNYFHVHQGPLREEEKDLLAASAKKQLKLFGVVVPPSNQVFDSWGNFRRFSSAVWRSKLLTASESAKDTAAFLLLPPPQHEIGSLFGSHQLPLLRDDAAAIGQAIPREFNEGG